MIVATMKKQFFVVLVLAILSQNSVSASPLPQLNIDVDSITVSGISAGGGFASQFHVAHSASLVGAAIFAGPPFYCAQANLDIALSSCMKDPALISVPLLVQETMNAAAINSIDATRNLANDKVWIFTGKKDTVVLSGVVEKTRNYYANFVKNSTNIIFYNTFPAEHAWITTTATHKCDFFGDPFMNNCSFDAVGDFLNHFYAPINPPGVFNSNNLLRFEQSKYVLSGVPSAISMGDTGYVYIPSKCASGSETCRLHVAFHGCNMDLATIGEIFVQHNGLNEYAESNNIVILYPQIEKSSVLPYNPKGCFDWWGYTGMNYSTKGAPQIKTVAAMIDAIAGSFGQ